MPTSLRLYGPAILFLFHLNQSNQTEAGRENSLAPFQNNKNPVIKAGSELNKDEGSIVPTYVSIMIITPVKGCKVPPSQSSKVKPKWAYIQSHPCL